MCGVVGFLSGFPGRDDSQVILTRMADSLRHRGPDDAGYWLDPVAGIALGHRRLSVLDLSVEGHQPMLCSRGCHVISFNGEIYNHESIRSELRGRGISFRGHSDTEVLIEAICAWGFEEALRRLDGMFAIASWDARQRTLYLARDSIGIKPLYYGWAGRSFVFASELKAIRRHPDFRGEIDLVALSEFFRMEYVPPPLSIYKGISKLQPGAYLSLRSPLSDTDDQVELRQFSSLRGLMEQAERDPLALSDEEAADCLEDTLRRAVRDQMVADVPVGAFLSGGVDSSTVVAVMQSQLKKPVPTFSIGFRGFKWDEAPFARAIARHLGTRHNEIYVSPPDMLSVIHELPSIYDEPFAEPSQLPVFILASEARKQVKVVLTGDGGDELFGGYAWYERFRRSWFIRDSLPWILRRPLARAMRAAGNSRTVSTAVGLASPRLEDILATRPHKLTAVLEADSPGDLYYQLRSEWHNAEALVLGDNDGTSRRNPYKDNKLCVSDMRLAGSYWDLATFLPEHPLAKVDRATMAVGLEARVPLLGKPVVEFALRLPAAQRIGRHSTKLLLRSVLHRYVPPSLVEHPKIGFEVPVGEWLRGPLRRWGAELLDPARLQAEGNLDVALVARTWNEHVSGERDHSRRLWSVLVFQAWLENQQSQS